MRPGWPPVIWVVGAFESLVFCQHRVRRPPMVQRRCTMLIAAVLGQPSLSKKLRTILQWVEKLVLPPARRWLHAA